jgi:hypothetical protein
MQVDSFLANWFEKRKAELDAISAANPGEQFPIRERLKLSSWLIREKANDEDLATSLSLVIRGEVIVPGMSNPIIIRSEAQEMLDAWNVSH